MLEALKTPNGGGRSRHALADVAIAGAVILLAACNSSPGTTTSQPKLVIMEFSFPCNLVPGTKDLCDGANDAAAKLPSGYTFQIKTGINFADNTAFNSLIQNSLQLNPAGLIIFPAGPSAQTPIMNQACAKQVKIIIFESSATGVNCQSAFVGGDSFGLGKLDAEWLIAHPPANGSKDVGIVTQPPGEFASTDARVAGFTTTVSAGGYHVVATAITDQSLAVTRSEVTNMVTAHPNLGAIFSANGPMGAGTTQALMNNHSIVQLTLDFDPSDVPLLLNGTLGAVAAQNGYDEGAVAVQTMAKLLQGEKVSPSVYAANTIVDKTNAQTYKSH
jgi:ABC-type sugar transport system substrate-binding protein